MFGVISFGLGGECQPQLCWLGLRLVGMESIKAEQVLGGLYRYPEHLFAVCSEIVCIRPVAYCRIVALFL